MPLMVHSIPKSAVVRAPLRGQPNLFMLSATLDFILLHGPRENRDLCSSENVENLISALCEALIIDI